MQVNESELDNLLMAQKDRLYDQLNEVLGGNEDGFEALKPDGFEQVSLRRINSVLDQLDLVCPLWNETSYGYKAKEILRRVEVALRNTRDDLHHAATAKRHELTKAIERCGRMYDCFRNLRDTRKDDTEQMSDEDRYPITILNSYR